MGPTARSIMTRLTAFSRCSASRDRSTTAVRRFVAGEAVTPTSAAADAPHVDACCHGTRPLTGRRPPHERRMFPLRLRAMHATDDVPDAAFRAFSRGVSRLLGDVRLDDLRADRLRAARPARPRLPRLHRAAGSTPPRRSGGTTSSCWRACSATRTRTIRRRSRRRRLVDEARAAVLRFFNADPRRVRRHLHAQRQRRAQAGRGVVPVRARRSLPADVRQPQLGERHPRVRAPPRGGGHLPAGAGARAARRWRSACPTELARTAVRRGRTCSPTPRSRTSAACSTRSSGSSWARDAGWHVILDCAAFAPTNRLDLAAVKPDFVPLSFYKMFGYPTGVGALIYRHEALRALRRPWFAGGTITVASVQGEGLAPPGARARRLRGRHRRLPRAAGGDDRPRAPGVDRHRRSFTSASWR